MSRVAELVEVISGLTLTEAADLVKSLEERFGISAQQAIPVPINVPTTPTTTVEEKTEFTVILKGFDVAKKINVIKAARAINGMPLKEAKDFVESAPKPLKESVSRQEAERLKTVMEAEGAVIEIV